MSEMCGDVFGWVEWVLWDHGGGAAGVDSWSRMTGRGMVMAGWMG